METTKAASFKTELNDRTLWYDGDSTVDSKTLMEFIMSGNSVDSLFVDEITPEINQYNKLVSKPETIRIKEEVQPLSFDWNIPNEYKNLDVVAYILDKLDEDCINCSDKAERRARVEEELILYKQLDLMVVLATLIYFINTLIKNNVVWGVGRGSSVSSYILYLIGVHDIDSYKYGLNIGEFLRTE